VGSGPFQSEIKDSVCICDR